MAFRTLTSVLTIITAFTYVVKAVPTSTVSSDGLNTVISIHSSLSRKDAIGPSGSHQLEVYFNNSLQFPLKNPSIYSY